MTKGRLKYLRQVRWGLAEWKVSRLVKKPFQEAITEAAFALENKTACPGKEGQPALSELGGTGGLNVSQGGRAEMSLAFASGKHGWN